MPVDRILIVSVCRSGSSNLQRSLSKIFKLESIQEPWNYNLHKRGKYPYPDSITNPSIVKTIVEHIPIEMENGKLLDFHLDLLSYYDNIILLSRKDRLSVAESYTYANKISTWHKQYSIDDVSELNIDIDQVNEWCDALDTLSKESGIGITWYENLYSGDKATVKESIDKWNFEVDFNLLFEKLNPKDRYRKFYDKKTVL